nr:PREDICTED: uncharacterized protein LOC106703417 [Latimeria chalumnae]|eukprot:XP_014343708.1 PREDICTED: uncharacterized protein LOC106703417 [Latimeria chalumnae]
MKIIGRQLLIIFSLPYCNIFFGMTKADGNQIVCSYQSTEQNLSLLFLSLNVTHADCYKTREKLCSFFNNTAQERRTCNMSRSKKDFHIDFFEIEDYLETACKLYYQRTSMLYVIKGTVLSLIHSLKSKYIIFFLKDSGSSDSLDYIRQAAS